MLCGLLKWVRIMVEEMGKEGDGDGEGEGIFLEYFV